MLFIKDGVSPRSFYIIAAVANAAQALELNVTITAGTNGKHMQGSLHYKDRAIDVRSKNLTDKKGFLSTVLLRLGSDYEGILEHEGLDNEHFHFEYDPKINKDAVNA